MDAMLTCAWQTTVCLIQTFGTWMGTLTVFREKLADTLGGSNVDGQGMKK